MSPPSARGRQRLWGLVAAGLLGAAGLALEVLWLAALGPALGHGRAAPFGLGAWIAGWACGAAAGGAGPRRGVSPARIALLGGALTAAGAAILLVGVVRSPAGWSPWVAPLGVVATAFGQGLALPLLAARVGLRTVWAVNLVGAVGGARLAAWDLPLRFGNDGAAFIAAGCALVAAALAALALREEGPPPMASHLPAVRRRGRLLHPHALWMGLGTAWLVIVQGVGLRVAALWFGGHQDATALMLVASLVALALGAACLAPLLPRADRGGRAGRSGRGEQAIAVVFVLGALGSVLVALGPGVWLAGWLGWGEPHGLASLARSSRPLFAFLLVAPALIPLGALVPALAHALREVGADSGPDARAEAFGALLLHEAWGGLLGAVLFPWVLVPRLGLSGALAAVLLAVAAGVAASAAVRWRLRPRPEVGAGVEAGRGASLAVAVGALCAASWVLFRAPSPVLATPALSNPAFERLSFAEDSDYAVTVVQDGIRGERTLLTDGFRATATGDDYLYMRALGHLPVLLHPAPRRVGVLALGTGTTVGAVALHPEVERIDVFELSRAVVAAAPFFEDVNHGALREGLPGLLDPHDGVARVVVHLGDGRRLLRALASESGGVLDVLTMEPLLPDAPFAVHLYTEGFYREARRALAPGGILCQWVPPHALAPEVFDAVVGAFRRAHPWSAGFLSGTQLLLVGAEAEPALLAERFPGAELVASNRGADGAQDAAGGGPAGSSGSLVQALAALGLESPSGLAARLVLAPDSDWESTGRERTAAAPRALTDADPWILYRERPRGVEALSFLPANLRHLAVVGGGLPERWSAAIGAAGRARYAALVQARACRLAWVSYRAALAGARLPQAADLGEVDRLRRQLNGDPFAGEVEVQQLDREVRYEHSTSRGLGALAGGDARGALEALTLAATARPGRADAHLYVAAAAARVGEEALAARALARALELCPRALETREGERALQLGLPRAPLTPSSH
ncbi:MAG: hypothetical protein R3F49_00765 [Planctomycetota bacterium]